MGLRSVLHFRKCSENSSNYQVPADIERGEETKQMKDRSQDWGSSGTGQINELLLQWSSVILVWDHQLIHFLFMLIKLSWISILLFWKIKNTFNWPALHSTKVKSSHKKTVPLLPIIDIKKTEPPYKDHHEWWISMVYCLQPLFIISLCSKSGRPRKIMMFVELMTHCTWNTLCFVVLCCAALFFLQSRWEPCVCFRCILFYDCLDRPEMTGKMCSVWRRRDFLIKKKSMHFNRKGTYRFHKKNTILCSHVWSYYGFI